MKLALLFTLLLNSFMAFGSSEIVYWFDRNIGETPPTIDEGTGFILEQDIAFKTGSRGNPDPGAKKWPNGVIPFEISSFQFNSAEKQAIMEAVRELSAKTNLTVKPRSGEANFVRVIRGQGCYSYIGVQGGAQNLSLGNGCVSNETIIHEFMHAAGIFHEHARNDRDQYIKVNHWNINPAARRQFEAVRHAGFGKYDYESIMHYESIIPSPSFVINIHEPVFVKKGSNEIIERNFDLTETDIATVNFLYPNGEEPKECYSLQYFDKKAFDRELKGYLEYENPFGTCVTFSTEFKVDELPQRLEKWFSKIKKSGGKVEKIEVSRSIFRLIFEYVFRFIFGIFENVYKPAENYNANIYYDKATKVVIRVEFVLR